MSSAKRRKWPFTEQSGRAADVASTLVARLQTIRSFDCGRRIGPSPSAGRSKGLSAQILPQRNRAAGLVFPTTLNQAQRAHLKYLLPWVFKRDHQRRPPASSCIDRSAVRKQKIRQHVGKGRSLLVCSPIIVLGTKSFTAETGPFLSILGSPHSSSRIFRCSPSIL